MRVAIEHADGNPDLDSVNHVNQDDIRVIDPVHSGKGPSRPRESFSRDTSAVGRSCLRLLIRHSLVATLRYLLASDRHS